MQNVVLIEFEDQSGNPISDKIQVPLDITRDQLKNLINTPLSLFINGYPVLESLKMSLEQQNITNNESVIKIRTSADESATQPATFCSSAYSGHEGPVLCIRYKNILVTGGSDSTLRFWDVVTKTQKKILKKHGHWVQCVDISDDGKYVVSGALDGSISLYSGDGMFIRSFIGHSNGVVCIRFFRDGFVSCSRDKSVKVFSLDGRCIGSYTHGLSVLSLAIGDNYFATGSRDGIIKIYYEPNRIIELKGHTKGVNSLDIQGAYIISGSDDGSVIIWKNFKVSKRLKHEREVLSVCISPNNLYLASASFDKSVRVWNIDSGKLIGKYFHVDFVYKVMFFNDLVISSSKDKTVKLFKPSIGKVVSDLVCEDEIYCFDFCDNELVCGCKSSKVYFFK